MLETNNYIESAISNSKKPVLNENLQDNFGDSVITYSLCNGQAIIVFDNYLPYSQNDYEKYYYNFMTKVVKKIECVIEGKRYMDLLKYDSVKDCNYKFFKRNSYKFRNFIKYLSPKYRRENGVHPEELKYELELLEVDIEQTAINVDAESLPKVWLKKTNTSELIKHYMSACDYFSTKMGNDMDDRTGKILNFIGVLTISSAVLDFWGIMDHGTPWGFVISFIVAVIILGLSFVLWPRR